MERLYKTLLSLFRCFYPRYHYSGPDQAVTPAVYIVHHQNLRGPITVLAWLPWHLRLWALSVFFTQKDCFRHYMDYTFTKRFGFPKIVAYIIVWPISFLLPLLMKLINAIPVYRSRKAVTTFRESLSALTTGQSLLICPDINYKDTGSNIGEIYSGFLNLEKYYYKKTSQHLAFIPLYIDHAKRLIVQGDTILFPDEGNFEEKKSLIAEKLKQEINKLANNPVKP